MANYSEMLVDTERKVVKRWKLIHQTLKNQPESIFPFQSINAGTHGKGNNWSCGYWKNDHLQDILNGHRKMLETNQFHQGTMIVHSVGGGTGSGLGSRLAQELRDLYPKQFLMATRFAFLLTELVFFLLILEKRRYSPIMHFFHSLGCKSRIDFDS